MSRTPPSTPSPRHKIKVYEQDPRQPLVPGHNPLQIDTLEVDYQARMPRRERAALAAMQTKFPGRACSIGHSPNGDMIATLIVQSSGQVLISVAGPSTPTQQLVEAVLRNPEALRELVRVANDPRIKHAATGK